MRMPGRSSPMLLAYWAVVGGLISTITFAPAVINLLHFHRGNGAAWTIPLSQPVLFALFSSPLLGGFALSLWAERRLRKGIEAHIWTDTQLESLRRGFDHAVWKWVAVSALATCFICLMLYSGTPYRMSLFWVVFLPLQRITHLHRTLRPATSSSQLLDLRSIAPIRSEHWGNAPRDASL